MKSVIRIDELTREMWAKYQWVDVTTNADPCTMLVRSYERTPDDAKRAWDQFEFWTNLKRAGLQRTDTDTSVDPIFPASS